MNAKIVRDLAAIAVNDSSADIGRNVSNALVSLDWLIMYHASVMCSIIVLDDLVNSGAGLAHRTDASVDPPNAANMVRTNDC